jgi:metal-sulfur cluster biosynthetic enzyme
MSGREELKWEDPDLPHVPVDIGLVASVRVARQTDTAKVSVAAAPTSLNQVNARVRRCCVHEPAVPSKAKALVASLPGAAVVESTFNPLVTVDSGCGELLRVCNEN